MWVIHKIWLHTHVGKLVVPVTPMAHHLGVGFVMRSGIEPSTVRSVELHRSAHPRKKRGASGKATGVNNVKAEPVQCNRVVIEARNQPGTNLVGARPAQDIPKIRIPDSSVYRTADQICEEIARKQANNADETDEKNRALVRCMILILVMLQQMKQGPG